MRGNIKRVVWGPSAGMRPPQNWSVCRTSDRRGFVAPWNPVRRIRRSPHSLRHNAGLALSFTGWGFGHGRGEAAGPQLQAAGVFVPDTVARRPGRPRPTTRRATSPGDGKPQPSGGTFLGGAAARLLCSCGALSPAAARAISLTTRRKQLTVAERISVTILAADSLASSPRLAIFRQPLT